MGASCRPQRREKERRESILWKKEPILQTVAVGATFDETTIGTYSKMAYPLTSSSPD